MEEIVIPEARGFAAAHDSFMSRGGGMQSRPKGARKGWRFTQGPLKGKTFDQAEQEFKRLWAGASPAIREKYARQEREGLLAPSETPRMAARLPNSRSQQLPPGDRDDDSIPDSIQRGGRMPRNGDGDMNEVPDFIQKVKPRANFGQPNVPGAAAVSTTKPPGMAANIPKPSQPSVDTSKPIADRARVVGKPSTGAGVDTSKPRAATAAPSTGGFAAKLPLPSSISGAGGRSQVIADWRGKPQVVASASLNALKPIAPTTFQAGEFAARIPLPPSTQRASAPQSRFGQYNSSPRTGSEELGAFIQTGKVTPPVEPGPTAFAARIPAPQPGTMNTGIPPAPQAWVGRADDNSPEMKASLSKKATWSGEMPTAGAASPPAADGSTETAFGERPAGDGWTLVGAKSGQPKWQRGSAITAANESAARATTERAATFAPKIPRPTAPAAPVGISADDYQRAKSANAGWAPELPERRQNVKTILGYENQERAKKIAAAKLARTGGYPG